MNSATAAPPSELRAHWPLLLCVLVGISTPSISIYALGQFMAPLESDFGWTRSEVTVGLSISLVLGFLVSPLVGRLVDKINARLIALPGLVLIGCGIAAFSLATDNLSLWIGLWAFHSGVGALVGPAVWLAVVPHVFERQRGIAMAIALCGNNLTTMFGPGVARILLDSFGWRTSFQLIALFWIGSALLLALFFFFDRRDLSSKAEASSDTGAVAPKVPLKAVFLSGTFIRLALSLSLIGVAGAAYSIHLAPALAENGLGLAAAATVAGFAGLTAIPGKLVTGWLFERLGPGKLGALVMALFATSAAIFAAKSESIALAWIASGCLGIAGGANLTLVTIAVSKFFGRSVFGVVYGTLMSLTALGAAIGPLLISVIYDKAGSYVPAFYAGIPIALVTAVLLQRLRKVDVAAD